MASLTRWTWVWVNSRSWWWTGRPGVLRFMGSRRVGHDWVTELNWTELNSPVVFPDQIRSDQPLSPVRLRSEFYNEEFMIWATVSSQSCFTWLYRASPSSAAKNIINLISVLTMYLVMSMCRVSCVAGRGCLIWPWRSLGKTLVSLYPASVWTPRPKLPVTRRISWLPTFAFQSPTLKKTSFFGC